MQSFQKQSLYQFLFGNRSLVGTKRSQLNVGRMRCELKSVRERSLRLGMKRLADVIQGRGRIG